MHHVLCADAAMAFTNDYMSWKGLLPISTDCWGIGTHLGRWVRLACVMQPSQRQHAGGRDLRLTVRWSRVRGSSSAGHVGARHARNGLPVEHHLGLQQGQGECLRLQEQRRGRVAARFSGA